MASHEQAGEKTEQATPRRLEEALKHGQFPHSAEVQTAFAIMAGVVALTFTGRECWYQMVTSVAAMLSHLHDIPIGVNLLQGYAVEAALVFSKCVGPVVGAVLLAGLLAGTIQNRFHTASEALTPNWDRLNPVSGFKRVFSVRSATPTVLAIVKLALIIGLTYSVVKNVLSDPVFFTAVSAARIAEFLADSAVRIMLRVGIVLAFVAAADYAYQYWQTNRDLMMTKQEVREEFKNTEGNPRVKALQRRQRGRVTVRQMLAEVPNADVVVTNPTHLAIALRYDRKTMRAPRIVAKGARLNAQRIREIAQEHQVPLVENKPLARLMYKYGRVGGEIPAQLYTAVAEVLAWVYRVNRYRYYAERNLEGQSA